MLSVFSKLSSHLNALVDAAPTLAVQQAREIDLDGPNRINLMALRAATLVNAGASLGRQDAIEEGLELYRELHGLYPTANITYNLANGLVEAANCGADESEWVDHQEQTRAYRAEARRCYWRVLQDVGADVESRTQAWTNIANLFAKTYRLSEAHDARLAALKVDPKNGVAAFCAASDLMWLFKRGGCSELTRMEAVMLARLALRNKERIVQYAGASAAAKVEALASELSDPPSRSEHTNPFIRWVEEERLTLAPAVELVEASLGKLDWLTLPGILESEPEVGSRPPPLFAMFNMLKSDFVLARDLTWRASDESVWPKTGQFADTLDYAMYGPHTSALILAHRTALDLLDKVAVTANYYFKLGLAPNKVSFGRLWRDSADKKTGTPLTKKVEVLIRAGVYAMYGLSELAEDYDGIDGILRSQKDLRNSGTHRFVVLHDLGDPSQARQAPEIEHLNRSDFIDGALRALRVARSAIQMLALAISQHEEILRKQTDGLIGTMIVPDHHWIRGEDEEL
ncbi:LA2681 family HEPN domain-containing protein [Pseudomonas alliivorans]|nr:LA2681 family HEPN domain-containing protein [Pseudomonas alliivorans]MEE4778095.1 LA2681 family HEPN domain-containing protein [Pseudomonas alliivorans]MEE5136418.1 LA2681 family HEPN domain-containing protein [Pseudomonas alliivorans]